MQLHNFYQLAVQRIIIYWVAKIAQCFPFSFIYSSNGMRIIWDIGLRILRAKIWCMPCFLTLSVFFVLFYLWTLFSLVVFVLEVLAVFCAAIVHYASTDWMTLLTTPFTKWYNFSLNIRAIIWNTTCFFTINARCSMAKQSFMLRIPTYLTW